MKKIAFFVLAVLFAVSCSIDGGYNQSYEIVTTFDYYDYKDTFGEDSLYFDNVGKKGILWNDLVFTHQVSEDGTFQGGFILSYLNPAGTDKKIKDQVVSNYRVTGDQFRDFDNIYAVFQENQDPSAMSEKDIKFLMNEYGTCLVRHCWINNTETVYDAAKNFENGDKLVLTATGYLGGVVTGTAEINLALPDTTIYTWTKFNLEKLGTVDAIDFDVYSSRSDVPAMFCLDELNARVDITY